MKKLPSLRKPDAIADPIEPIEPAPAKEAPTPASKAGSRISLKMLFVFTLVVAVAAACYGGMRRDSESRAFYVIFATAAPLIVLVAAGVAHQLLSKRR